jgi:hypothetical protein
MGRKSTFVFCGIVLMYGKDKHKSVAWGLALLGVLFQRVLKKQTRNAFAGLFLTTRPLPTINAK